MTAIAILLIDDDALLLGSLTKLLIYNGFIVTPISNFEELQSLSDEYITGFSGVITDYDLKQDNNGIDVLRYLAKKGLQVPCLIHSASIIKESISDVGLDITIGTKDATLQYLLSFTQSLSESAA